MKTGLHSKWTLLPAVLCLLVFCLSASATERDENAEQVRRVVEGKGKTVEQKGKVPEQEVDRTLKTIRWLGHACFRIEGDRVVYFDPFELKQGAVPADVIFITHGHSDHCSPGDTKRIQKKGTVVVTTSDCAKKLSGTIVTVKPGDTLTVEGLKIQVVPAYNINKRFHPKEKGWVGFVVTMEGRTIYHAGDTDLIPEMKNIDADVALLPVSGTYVMTAEEAAEAAKVIGPLLAVPMHYGTIVGDEKDAQTFKEKCGVRAEILKRETR